MSSFGFEAQSLNTQIAHLRNQYEKASGRFEAMTEEIPKAMGAWFDNTPLFNPQNLLNDLESEFHLTLCMWVRFRLIEDNKNYLFSRVHPEGYLTSKPLSQRGYMEMAVLLLSDHKNGAVLV